MPKDRRHVTLAHRTPQREYIRCNLWLALQTAPMLIPETHPPSASRRNGQGTPILEGRAWSWAAIKRQIRAHERACVPNNHAPDMRSSRTGDVKPEPWVRRPNRDGESTGAGLGAGMRPSARRLAAQTLGRPLGTARYHALRVQHRSPYSR